MKKAYSLLVALIFGAAMMVHAAPLAKNNIKNNTAVINHTEASTSGTLQDHRRRVIHHRRRVIHHRRRHRSPHATVIIHH